MPNALALHTWTLDTTPLAEALAAARDAGWDAVELRRLDFERARQAGRTDADTVALVARSGLRVACVGVQVGWMFAEGDERQARLAAFAESCRWAQALGAGLLMSPVDPGTGPVARAVDSLREVGDLAGRHGLRLAIEMNFRAALFNDLARLRNVLARAGHPACGLLLDTYQLARAGTPPGELGRLAPAEVAHVQLSDVPRADLRPDYVLDRLPPGQGRVDFTGFFAVLRRLGYAGPLSYEAPNEA
ncbi:MAG TPA: sugar phosphate isomerase/epimerase family protein, partial [Candidatus Tectomicrobia bacterium]|nr:sugar phosphate isomerase/epimerase family protein [Candidatus Tectomicrobia bacterium]